MGLEDHGSQQQHLVAQELVWQADLEAQAVQLEREAQALLAALEVPALLLEQAVPVRLGSPRPVRPCCEARRRYLVQKEHQLWTAAKALALASAARS